VLLLGSSRAVHVGAVQRVYRQLAGVVEGPTTSLATRSRSAVGFVLLSRSQPRSGIGRTCQHYSQHHHAGQRPLIWPRLIPMFGRCGLCCSSGAAELWMRVLHVGVVRQQQPTPTGHHPGVVGGPESSLASRSCWAVGLCCSQGDSWALPTLRFNGGLA